MTAEPSFGLKGGHYVLFAARLEREKGLERIRIAPTDGTPSWTIDFPEPAYYKAHAHLLPCPIRYGKSVNQLRFPARLLDKPLLLADATPALVLPPELPALTV